jgi:hypothetical protein
LKFIIDNYIYKIIIRVFILLCNYYIILYYNGALAWGLDEGLTTPHLKKTAVQQMAGNFLAIKVQKILVA